MLALGPEHTMPAATSEDEGDGEGEGTSDIILLFTSKPMGEEAASARHTNDTQARQYIEHLPNQA